jgi:hypothetical protein
MSFFDDVNLDKQAAQDEEEFNSPDWTPEEGDTLNCVVLDRKVVDTKYGVKLVLVIRNAGDKSGGIDKGASGNLWCPAVLTRKVLEIQPAQGSAMSVRFEGKVTPEKGGNPYNNHTLVVEKTDIAWWAGVRDRLDETPRGQTTQAQNLNKGGDWF